MNKRIAFILITVLVTACLCTAASANSWGLKGDLYRAVEKAGTWDDYTALSNQADDFAVMGSRYHNALFLADIDPDLHVYTTAVYQPEDKKPAPQLTVNDDFDLTIAYGGSESYTFSFTLDGYELTGAEIGNFHLEIYPADGGVYDWHFSTEDGEETAVFPVTVMLDTFNIKLFPHSAAEVRMINHMHALLEDTRFCLGFGSYTENPYSPDRPGELLEPKKKGTAPVYSAPSAKAWRAGKGKAAMGTNGSMWVLKQTVGEDGSAYACIRYDVSERTQRIGWTLCSDLGLADGGSEAAFVHTQVETIRNTFLTDDPDVSQFPQFTIPDGTKLTCLGLYNEYYAYVAATEKNGKLSGKGNAVWGFVPVRDLRPAQKQVRKDIMKKAAGVWYAYGGGPAGDILILNADGSFVSGLSGSPDDEPELLEGTWYVTDYNPAEGLYPGEPSYGITLLYDIGTANVYGMNLTDEHLSLLLGENGGSYDHDSGMPDGDVTEDDEEQ